MQLDLHISSALPYAVDLPQYRNNFCDLAVRLQVQVRPVILSPTGHTTWLALASSFLGSSRRDRRHLAFPDFGGLELVTRASKLHFNTHHAGSSGMK